MRYVSTKGSSGAEDIFRAFAGSTAADGGLFMPESIPQLPRAFYNNIGDMTMAEIGYVVASTFLGDNLAAGDIKRIADASFSCVAPMAPLDSNTYVLELFHGPTLTFKDYGARFLSQTLSLLDACRGIERRTVLVATTGNSGAAAANALRGQSHVRVVVLYPKGRLSRMQQAQFATVGANVMAVEVDGTIEDCKRLQHQAMADAALAHLNLATPNSLNVGRVIPQMVFALHAYARLCKAGVRNADRAVYAIPSGNGSNVAAAMMAVASGMPCGRIVGACNANGSLSHLMAGEAFGATLRTTIASSLDVAAPSAAPRLRYMMERYSVCKERLQAAVPCADAAIAAAVHEMESRYGYLIDPHGAVAYNAVRDIADAPRVIYATGHPAKSLDAMTSITGHPVELPVQLNRFMGGHRSVRYIPANVAALRRLLTK